MYSSKYMERVIIIERSLNLPYSVKDIIHDYAKDNNKQYKTVKTILDYGPGFI